MSVVYCIVLLLLLLLQCCVACGLCAMNAIAAWTQRSQLEHLGYTDEESGAQRVIAGVREEQLQVSLIMRCGAGQRVEEEGIGMCVT